MKVSSKILLPLLATGLFLLLLQASILRLAPPLIPELMEHPWGEQALILGSSGFIILILILATSIRIKKVTMRRLATIEKIFEGSVVDRKEPPKQDLRKMDEIDTILNSLSHVRKHIDITHKSMQRLAYFDKLTGLPNRAFLLQELRAKVSSARRKHEHFALMFVDLDDFKAVNDTLGHEVGDNLLLEVTRQIQCRLRENDHIVLKHSDENLSGNSMLARLGGDEFILLLDDVKDSSAVSKIAERILATLSSPFSLDKHEVQVGASVGIAMFPEDGENPEDLLNNADIAMFEAKNQGKNTFKFFTNEMNAAAHGRLALEIQLRKALDNHQFLLHFLPRKDLSGNNYVGFEALLRWDDENSGIQSPGHFLHVAEESLLICEIGYWVFETVCRSLKEWLELGYTDLRISINLSEMQVYRGDTFNMLKTLMTLYDIPGKHLEIEVSESSLQKDHKVATEFLKKLKTLGVWLALDDFGTGMSALSYLRTLPIDVIKIDRSLLNENTEGSRQMIQSIIGMAKNLNLETVIEGVESKEQLAFAKEIKCDFAQGYLYSKPLSLRETDNFIHKYRGDFAGALVDEI